MKQPVKEPVFRNAYPCRSCIRCRCCPCICPPGGNNTPPLVVLVEQYTLLYKPRLVRCRKVRVRKTS